MSSHLTDFFFQDIFILKNYFYLLTQKHEKHSSTQVTADATARYFR